jgi:hypothetical protein
MPAPLSPTWELSLPWVILMRMNFVELKSWKTRSLCFASTLASLSFELLIVSGLFETSRSPSMAPSSCELAPERL